MDRALFLGRLRREGSARTLTAGFTYQDSHIKGETMTIETEEVTRVTQRSNDLLVEAAKTLIDSAYVAPRQALELSQSVASAMDANQELSRALSEKLVRQSVEAQTLWWQFFQTSIGLTLETVTRVSEIGLAASRDQERVITGQTVTTEKRTSPATK